MIQKDSIYRENRSINIPIVNRFKLSKIYNIDQTPILFKISKKKTYYKKKNNIIYLK
jgi:hypothetical protein